MELIKFDLENETMAMALLPLYQAYEAEISEDDLDDFGEFYPEDSFDDLYEVFQGYLEGKTTYICVIDGEYRGFVAFHVDTDEIPGFADGYRGWGHLSDLYTCKQSRGLGMGKMLVGKADEELKKLGITAIHTMNMLPANFGFWMAVGYTDTGKIEPEEGGWIVEKYL